MLKPTTVLRRFIEEAENTYGPKLRYSSVALVPEGEISNPFTSFCTDETNQSRMAIVLLGERTFADEALAEYQLAHEAIHCLAGSMPTTCLEEGLATHFSLHNSVINGDRAKRLENVLDQERTAYLALIRQLLCKWPNAIRDLRHGGARPFGEIKIAELVEYGVSQELAEILCKSTDEWRTLRLPGS